MKAEQLWASILQEAIQGRLVPQLESEPEVNEAWETPEDEPFTIPEKWKWANFGELVDFSLGKTPERANDQYWKGNIDWVSISDITKSDGRIKAAKEAITHQALTDCFKSKLVPKGTLLMSFKLSIGKVAITDIDCVHNEAIISIFPKRKNILKEFLFYVLPILINFVETTGAIKGATLNKSKLKLMFIPVPPEEEQRRIVARLDELKPILEKYEREHRLYNHLVSTFPDKLKASILLEAIQGRLVPQLESEPPVEQIGKLIDKIPFPIPCKWKWIQLKHATMKITDGTHHSPPSFNKGDFLYITAKNIKSSGVDLANVTYVSKNIHEEIFKRCNPEPGDVLFIKDGATTGVVTINNLENPFSLLSSVALLKVKREILLPEFLIHVLRSQYTRDLVARQMQGTGIPRVTLKKLKELWIPIPPLNEQYRISIKLQNLIATIPCEN